MVYVPHPNEREDGMSGWRTKSKSEKAAKKNAKNADNNQVILPPGALAVMSGVTGGAVAGAAPGMMVMQPPPVEPGSVVIVTQPSQQPGQVVAVQVHDGIVAMLSTYYSHHFCPFV